MRTATAPEFDIFQIDLATASIEDLTIRGGRTGVYNSRANLALTKCTISGNALGLKNGGTLTIADSAISGNIGYGGLTSGGLVTVTLTNSSVTGNSARFDGGGINKRDSFFYVTNSVIAGNTAGARGGGIFNYQGFGTLVLTNSSVTGNVTGGRGGGIYNHDEMTSEGSTISGNRAAKEGGGIFSERAKTFLIRTTISGNTSDIDGGGLLSTGGSELELTESTVSGNSSVGNGGGIFADSPLLVAINSTISGNRAKDGAGVYINASFPRTVEFVDNTVSGNAATGQGGGIFAPNAVLDFRRNLVAGNVAVTGAEVGLGNVSFDSDEFNLFGHSGLSSAQAFSGFTPDVADKVATSDGGTPKALAAILSPLALNTPGTTQTHALPSGSPAINAGGTTCSATDQRGVVRPQGSACDAGAFEDDGRVFPPRLTIANASVTEGNTGTVNLSFKVRLSAPAPAAVRVNFATQDGTAKQPGDYVAKTGTLNIAKGKTSGDIVIQVKGDTAIEPNETFKVLLSNPRGASITTGTATGTIRNDDRPRLSINDVSLAEGNSGQKNATFTVRLSPAATGPVTVKFATADGTALRPSDYVAKSGTLNFAAGQTSKTILIPVKGDRSKEANETFRVNLSAATGASIADAQGIGTIGNDD